MGSYQNPNPQAGGVPPYGAPAPKKTSPWIFVLIGCVGLIVIVTLILVAGGWFVFTKARQAGLDPELMRRNPEIAVAKMLAAINPDVEVVSVDERAGRITLRDKKTGKTVTMDLDEVKRGRIVFESEGGEKTTIESSGEGEQGSVRVQSPEGTVEYGAGTAADVPGWVPRYPGSTPKGVTSTDTPEARGGAVSFTIAASAAEVIKFYAGELERAGFKVRTVQHSGEETGGMVNAQSAGGARTVMVMVGPGDGGVTVAVSFSEKK
jgi:hypothetical protein